MNYLNEQKNMQFWQGTIITKLAQNEVFVYGSNPLLSSYLKCPFYCPKLNLLKFLNFMLSQ